jgi:hypothetical protein
MWRKKEMCLLSPYPYPEKVTDKVEGLPEITLPCGAKVSVEQHAATMEFRITSDTGFAISRKGGKDLLLLVGKMNLLPLRDLLDKLIQKGKP